MEEEVIKRDKLSTIKNGTRASMLMVIISCLGTLMLGIENHKLGIELLKCVVYTIVIDFLILYYIGLYRDKVFDKSYAWWIVNLGYLISICLLIPNIELTIYPLWMIGTVLIAYLVDVNLSFLMTYGLIFMAVTVRGLNFEVVILQVILGTFLCLLAKYLKRAKYLIYLSIFISSMTLTLFFIRYDFELDQVLNIHTLIAIATSISVMFAAFIIGRCVNKIYGIDTKEDVVKTNAKDILKNESLEMNNRLAVITDENFPLLIRLAKEAPKLYYHCKLVAELSKRAAIHIGANEELAYAGGLYHEVGRLEGKDYVELGEKLAKEYDLPEELIQIIRQHNYKCDLPKSEEAAIVMLSDNIISTIFYLKGTGQSGISNEKIIENTFHVRFKNGTLDESGITLQKFNKLKHFYLLERKLYDITH